MENCLPFIDIRKLVVVIVDKIVYFTEICLKTYKFDFWNFNGYIDFEIFSAFVSLWNHFARALNSIVA